MKVTLRVTAKHIEEGVSASCTDCPVALALYAIVKPDYYIDVQQERMRVESADGRILWSAPNPKIAREFIVNFDYPCDCGDEVCASRTYEPFECELDIPQWLLP